MKKIYFIRHGKTNANLQKIYCGWTDVSILEEEKIRLKNLVFPKVDRIYSSPSLRCIQTLELCYPKQSYQRFSGLKEIYFGEFEGKDYKTLSKDIRYQEWINSMGEMPFPSGESKSTFVDRVGRCFKDIYKLEEDISKGDLCIISHEGVYRAFLYWISKGEIGYFDRQIKNGQCVEITQFFNRIRMN